MLANKYIVPWSTVISWIRKARLYNSLSSSTANTQEGPLNITPDLHETTLTDDQLKDSAAY